MVGDFDDNLRALMMSVEGNCSAGELGGAEALVSWLNAVVDGVADKVRERLGKRVENTFVEIGVFAGDFQGDVFAAEFRDVANDPRKSAEELFDGNHADFEDALVKFVEDARLECQGLGELAADWIACALDVELCERSVKHVLADDQFTDEIHDRVDARGGDTGRAFGNGGNRNRAIAVIGRRRNGGLDSD